MRTTRIHKESNIDLGEEVGFPVSKKKNSDVRSFKITSSKVTMKMLSLYISSHTQSMLQERKEAK